MSKARGKISPERNGGLCASAYNVRATIVPIDDTVVYVRHRTDGVGDSAYGCTMRLSRDLILVPSASPGKTCGESKLMMARVQPGGILELLSAAAWARTLGYALEELRGKSLCGLMPPGKRAADEVMDALLDEKNVLSVLEVTLRCKNERRKYFRFHRRFDPYGDAIYVIADEVPEKLAAELTISP